MKASWRSVDRWRGRTGITALLAVVGLLYVLPMAMIVYGAFRTDAPGLPSAWTLSGAGRAFSDGRTYRTFGNSLLLSLCAGVPATLLATVLAWIVARTTAALRRAVTGLMMITLATPPLFFALSWALLGAPRAGLLNKGFAAVGLPDDTVNVSGLWGTALVMTLKICSLAYFMMIGAFLSMDHRLEEASYLSGAGRLRTFLRINVPIMAPAVSGALVIALVIGLIAFDVPLIIGVPGGFRVFSTQIYSFVSDTTPPDYAGASSLAMILIAVVVLLVVLKWRVLDRRRYATVTGKAGAPRPVEIGRWTWACNALIVLYALLAVVLPTAQLIIGSLQPVFGVPGAYSLVNYRDVLADPLITPALRSTFLLAVLGGLAAVTVSVTIGMVGRHAGARLRRTLELSTWLPWATNGILLGLGLTWAFLTVPVLRPLFGTFLILLIGLMVAATPLTSRTTDGALAQIGLELEESARTSGASALRSAAGIVLRLILPSFVAAWFIAAIFIAGNLEVPVLLSTPANPAVSVEVFQLYQNGETSQAAALFCLVVLAMVCFGAALAGLQQVQRRIDRRRLAGDGGGAGAGAGRRERPRQEVRAAEPGVVAAAPAAGAGGADTGGVRSWRE